jgi:hypothetical protein
MQMRIWHEQSPNNLGTLQNEWNYKQIAQAIFLYKTSTGWQFVL